MLITTVQEELSSGSFEVAGLEWDTHGYREGDPLPMELSMEDTVTDGLLPTNTSLSAVLPSATSDEEPDGTLPIPHRDPASSEGSVRLLLGGRIDRVDIYRAGDGETVYVRVVDYKSSAHDFSVRAVTEDMDLQLLLYLFTLCSPRNRSLFASSDGTLPTRVLPASMVYMSPDESTREGVLRPRRSGVVLDLPEITAAVGEPADPSETFLPSVRRAKTGKLSGNGLYTPDRMAELEVILRDAITQTAARMYSGCASRTPSPDACRYCPVRGSCGVSEAEE
jgi:ATP-dependent helicase/nuclease subunit B